MSVTNNAFGKSAQGAFIESAQGARAFGEGSVFLQIRHANQGQNNWIWNMFIPPGTTEPVVDFDEIFTHSGEGWTEPNEDIFSLTEDTSITTTFEEVDEGTLTIPGLKLFRVWPKFFPSPIVSLANANGIWTGSTNSATIDFSDSGIPFYDIFTPSSNVWKRYAAEDIIG